MSGAEWRPRLTLAQVATYPRPGMDAPMGLGFTPDNAAVLWLHAAEGGLTQSLWRHDIASGDRRVLAGPGAGPEGELSLEEELRRERTRTRETGVTSYRWAREADPPVLMIPGPRLRIAVGDDELREHPQTEGAVDPSLSPDGSRLALVRGGDLYVIDADPDSASAPIRLSDDAEDGLTTGLADFIAQEEFGQMHGHWWSRDGRRIAALRVDARQVPEYPIVHQGGDGVEVERHRYPFAGDNNALVSLLVYDADGGEPTVMPLPQEDGYLARVAWWPDPTHDAGRLVAQWLDRDQQRLRLLAFDDDGAATILIDESQAPWINIDDQAQGLADGRFIWSDETTGYRHLSLRAHDGTELRRLTGGEWVVTSLIGVDEDAGWVYFGATRESPLQRHIYRAGLEAEGGELERLSDVGGVNGAVLSRDGRYLLASRSSLEDPPSIALIATAGGAPQTLYASQIRTDTLGLTPPQLRSFSAADGTTLYGALYRADGEGAEEDAPPPLLAAVYGGPHAQTVLDAWGLTVDLRAQYLAQQGYLVLKLDNRGMANRGLGFEAAIQERMGTVEVEDQALAVRRLAEEGEADLERVGVYGWSYGGYMTVMSMLREPDLFTVGVAGAPVSDWDGYDTGYTERYMSTPQANAEGYREGSLLTHAAKLEGKLLLVHGGVDENVHFRHTARLITALTAADRDYDLLLFPSERHMPRDRAGIEYQERKLAQYFDQHLKRRR